MEGKLFNTLHVSYFGFTGMTAVWFWRFDCCCCIFCFPIPFTKHRGRVDQSQGKVKQNQCNLGYFRRSNGNFSNATKSNFCVISIHCHQRSDFNNLVGVLFDDRIEHQILFYLKLAVEIPNAVFIFSFQAEMNFCKNFVNTCCGFWHLKESHWV